MGSGKTTVGRLLAADLGWTFVDLDDEIAARCGMSIPEIFSRFGEPRFRQEEAVTLAQCLTCREVVLALGGGAPETESNRILLRQSPDTAVVYLQGDFEILHARCMAQSLQPGAVARPVLADTEAARQRFTQRTPLYAGIATATTFSSGERSARSIAEEIAVLLDLRTA